MARSSRRLGRGVVLALTFVLVLAGCGGRAAEVVEGTLAKRPAGERAAAASPEVLAARLTTVEQAIRHPATPASDLDRLGREQQSIYRTLAGRPESVTAVIDRVPADLRAAVQANLVADAELASLGVPGDDLPRWRIVAPPPPDTLMAEYKAAETATGVPWPYLAAIHLVETRMSRIRGTSSAGAQGPMQFIPSTWAIYGAGGDINSDHDAILAAARLLKARGAPTNTSRALYAYNNSDHYVRAVTAYAEIMGADERAYAGYHAWQVFYGDRLLPEGFSNP